MSLQQRLEASWATRGPLAWLLLPLSLLFRGALALRRGLALAGLLRVERLPVPVVVVGNLVVGGAGKTPTVIAVVALLRSRGWAPGSSRAATAAPVQIPLAVTRDTAAHACGDEPLLIRLRTGAPVQVGRDRVAAARALCAAHPEVDILVADDGLQHLRLARDAQLIVFDERGAGNGLLLPAGPLREPLPREAPPRTWCSTTRPRPAPPGRRSGAARLAGAVPLAAWWARRGAEPGQLDSSGGRPLLAAAGVARPGRFFAMLRGHGLQIDELALPDHHAFDALPWPSGTADVILTEKDAVKLPLALPLGATRVWVAPLDFELDRGLGARAVSGCCPRPQSNPRNDDSTTA